MASRRRHCSLCRQRYGSGFRDNVAASDVLRARRMLVERSDARSDIRRGLELFLDDLTKQRELDGNQHAPLDLCAFCTQFLPSASIEDQPAANSRSTAFLRASRQLHVSREHHSAPSMRRWRASSLVIQHQFAAPSAPPTGTPAFRLLTSDATRVLRVEDAGADPALQAIEGGATRSLRLREKQQAAEIVGATLEDARRRRTLLLQQQALAQHEAAEEARKANIVYAMRARGGADALYAGAALKAQSPPAAGALRVRSRKTGRHWKTELVLPSV